jgi:hypothetical protein
MNKKQFTIIILIQLITVIIILFFVNFRTPPREARKPPELDQNTEKILKLIYPKLALYIPNLYEMYFDGISYDENHNKIIILSDYCHLRELGCFDGCLLVTIDNNFKIIKIGGCAMPTVSVKDTLDTLEINKLKRSLISEMRK